MSVDPLERIKKALRDHGALSQSGVIAETQLRPSTVQYFLNALEAEGIIQKHDDPAFRARRDHYTLTLAHEPGWDAPAAPEHSHSGAALVGA